MRDKGQLSITRDELEREYKSAKKDIRKLLPGAKVLDNYHLSPTTTGLSFSVYYIDTDGSILRFNVAI